MHTYKHTHTHTHTHTHKLTHTQRERDTQYIHINTRTYTEQICGKSRPIPQIYTPSHKSTPHSANLHPIPHIYTPSHISTQEPIQSRFAGRYVLDSSALWPSVCGKETGGSIPEVRTSVKRGLIHSTKRSTIIANLRSAQVSKET
jgi:hypothetical protein